MRSYNNQILMKILQDPKYAQTIVVSDLNDINSAKSHLHNWRAFLEKAVKAHVTFRNKKDYTSWKDFF